MKNSLEVYNVKQRIFFVKTFYQDDGDCEKVRKNYINTFSHTNDSPIPTDEIIMEIIRLFEETGNVFDHLPLKTPDPQIDLIFFANDQEKFSNQKNAEVEEIEFDENLFDIPNSVVAEQYDPHTFIKVFDKHQNYETAVDEAFEKTLEELEDPTKSLEASLSPLPSLETASLEETIKELEESLQKAKIDSTKKNRRKVKNVEEKKKIICEVCGKNFANKSRLEQHHGCHRDGKAHQCPHCGKTFKWTFAFSRHLKIHNIDETRNPFKCKFCEKSYKFERYLQIHVKNIYERQIEYKCNWCKLIFISQVELMAHWKTHNEGIFLSDMMNTTSITKIVSDLQCSECGKIFSSRDSLKKHMTLHTGKLPYNCEVCGKGFIWKEGVRRHLFKHLSIVSETSPTCNICGKRMSRESTLKNHMKIHQKPEHPFKCSIEGCEKSFSGEHLLNRHVTERHTNKRFKCTYCTAEYKDKHQLKIHTRRIHLKEDAPYKCSNCHKDFWVKRDFRIHIKKHHNVEFT